MIKFRCRVLVRKHVHAAKSVVPTAGIWSLVQPFSLADVHTTCLRNPMAPASAPRSVRSSPHAYVSMVEAPAPCSVHGNRHASPLLHNPKIYLTGDSIASPWSGSVWPSCDLPLCPPIDYRQIRCLLLWGLKNVKFFFISKCFPSHQSKLPAFPSTNEQNHFLCELVHLKGFILNDKVYDMHVLLILNFHTFLFKW